MLHALRNWAMVVVLVMVAGAAAAAPPASLPAPQGPVVLTVTGQIAVANAPGAAAFDLALLESLGTETIRTTTIWTDGVQEFTGVPLHSLLQRLGAQAGVLEARAINDYATQLPVSDAVPGGALIAYRRNGQPMPVRDRGPLWIVYPYDKAEEYRREIIYARSIWQLERIHVRPDAGSQP